VNLKVYAKALVGVEPNSRICFDGRWMVDTLHYPDRRDAMDFLLVVTLLALALGISAALLPFAAFNTRLTRPFRREARWKTTRTGRR
jgi:hypothetical protein